MRSDLFVLGEEEAGLAKDKAKIVLRNFKDISKTLAIVFLVVEAFGLLSPTSAKVALVINVLFLTWLVLYRAAVGILTTDIIQEFLPEKKKEEIQSWYYIGRVAIAVGGLLFLLVLRAYVPFASVSEFFMVLVFLIVGILLMGMGTLQKKAQMHFKIGLALVLSALLVIVVRSWGFGEDWLINPIYDGYTLGHLGDPDHIIRWKIRTARRHEVNELAAAMTPPDDKNLTSENLYETYSKTAKSTGHLHVDEDRLIAEIDGTYLPAGPVQVIPAENTDMWIPLHMQVFRGDTLCVEGKVWNILQKGQLDGQGHLVPPHVGPHGEDLEEIDGHTRFDPRFKMLQLMFRFDGDPNRIQGAKDGCFTVEYDGFVEARINQPHLNANGLEAPSFSGNSRGAFSVTRFEKHQAEVYTTPPLHTKTKEGNSPQLLASSVDYLGRTFIRLRPIFLLLRLSYS